MDVGLLRSRLVHALLAALIPLLFVAGTIALAAAITPALIGGLPLAIIGGVFAALTRVSRPRPVVHRGPLTVRDGSIALGDRSLVARDRVVSGVMMDTFVRLERTHGGPLDLAVADAEQGRQVLVALGLDPEHAVARFPLLATSPRAWQRRSWWAVASVFPLLVAIPLALTLHAPALIPLLAPFVVAMALSTIVPARVTVGSDGISARRFGREEFISLDGIEDAVTAEEETTMNAALAVVRLLDADGAVVRTLVVDQKKQGPFTEALHAAIDARAEALAARIREVLATRRKAGPALDPRTLARGDRETTAWIGELRALLRKAHGFRDAEAPTEDGLLAIVEDASAQPIDRVAAAIALAPSSPERRARVRIAAEATAEPKLRVALEAAIEPDEQALADAVDELAIK